MSAQQTKKLLTREQFANLAIEVTDWMIEHEDGLERDDFVRLLDHIQAANVYAKPEPSVQQMTTALGRYLKESWAWKSYECRELIHYPEVAMKAARLLGDNVEITMYTKGTWISWPTGERQPCDSLEDACTKLVRHLYTKHIDAWTKES